MAPNVVDRVNIRRCYPYYSTFETIDENDENDSNANTHQIMDQT